MDSHDNRPEFDARDPDGRFAIDPAVLSDPFLTLVTKRLAERIQTKQAPSAVGQALLPTIPQDEIDEFCGLLIQEDASFAQGYFDQLRADGATLETLCIGYLTPAARRLGELWCSDDCSFLEVTLGCSRLHGLLRGLRPDFSAGAKAPVIPHTALFAAAPGETHVLGLTMAADFFRRAGWAVDLITHPDRKVLVGQATMGGYDMIGLTVGCEAMVDGLAALVADLRAAAPNSKIVMGGHLSELDPDTVESLGLDAILTDVINAPFACQSILKDQSKS